jgi:MFS superfamily sulfate permease-like transporter
MLTLGVLQGIALRVVLSLLLLIYRTSHPPAKHVFVDAEAVNLIEVSASDALLNLIRELQSQSITFAIARVRDCPTCGNVGRLKA